MVKKWQKQLEKYPYKSEISAIIRDIILWDTEKYDIVKLSWFHNHYRIRKWKVRIVFKKLSDENEIIAVDTRWQIYKGM